jgi:sigma54-dependent transcription regulator
MAEVLSLLASGVGVAGFALQLADSVVKLKSFCDSVRSAPEELKELFESLDHTRQMLDAIAGQQQPELDFFDPGLLAQSINMCQNAVQRVKAETDKLDMAMPRRRLRTSAKWALK